MPEQINEFWLVVVDVWSTGVFGVDVGRILAALAVFAVFYVLRGLLTRFVLAAVDRFTKKTETRFDDQLHDALAPPFRFAVLVLGVFFAIQVLQPVDALLLYADRLIRSLIAVVIFWSIHNLVAPVFRFLFSGLSRALSVEIFEWLITGLKWAVIIIGASAVLEMWGVNVAAVIAGLGLFGAAVALGAQDLFKNLIAGISILAEKRFRRGDWILVDGIVEGTVESIGFRSTKVRRFDKAPVYVPNTKFADNAVTNFSAMTHRRIYWKIGVEYRSTVDQLRQIRDQIEDYVMTDSRFAKPPAVATFVRIDAFGDSAIDIMLYCFTRTTVWGEWLEIKEDLALRIKEIVEGAGTGFAFPSRSVYVETLPGGSPEIFIPPGSSNT